MKTTFYFVIVLCLSLLSACRGEETQAEAVRVDTLSLVMQVKECARLYTAEYEVHKLVLKDDPLRVKGNLFQRAFDVKVPIGERKVMIPLDVTLKAYIDFTGFDEKNVLRSGDRIVVTLPDPRVVVTSSRINHDEVKQFVFDTFGLHFCGVGRFYASGGRRDSGFRTAVGHFGDGS